MRLRRQPRAGCVLLALRQSRCSPTDDLLAICDAAADSRPPAASE